MNYIEFEGRKISVRPAVKDYEIDKDGAYVRQTPWFREPFGDSYKNPVEDDRYTLFWAKDCAWSNRVAIVYSLLGLNEAIKEEIVDWTELELPVGWECLNSNDCINKESNARFVGELYYKSDKKFIGRPSVPLLFDYKRQIIANNDHQNMTYYLERDFKPYHSEGAPNLLPINDEEEIVNMGSWLYDNINNAIYRMCFAANKVQYKIAYGVFYKAMEDLEQRLSNLRFIFGDHITDSDIRLFSTLVRLDVDYGKYLNLDIHLIDYVNLFDYCREIYQIPKVREKTFFDKICRKEFTEQDINNVEILWLNKVDRKDKIKLNESIFIYK